MLLTVQDLRVEFGLKEECDCVFHGNTCQGKVQVFGTLGKQMLILKFDNRIEFFEFLIEAKNLIENNIWKEISFTSTTKRGIKSNNKTSDTEIKCLNCAIEINKRVQEILNQYVDKKPNSLNRDEVLLKNIINNTKETLINLEQLGKFTNLL